MCIFPHLVFRRAVKNKGNLVCSLGCDDVAGPLMSSDETIAVSPVTSDDPSAKPLHGRREIFPSFSETRG
jgi:hypothetical protein